MAILRLLSFITFLLLQVVFFEASGQNAHRLYEGQYRSHKRAEPRISFKNIKKKETITLYGNTGYATYYGDLCKSLNCFRFRPQLSLGISVRTTYLKKRLSLRLEARTFMLYSGDYYTQTRNLDFRSTNFEMLALGQIDLFPYEKMMRRRTLINPYVFGGVGFFTYDPYGKVPGTNKWVDLRPLHLNGGSYGSVAMAIPVGIGFKLRYSYKWNFMFEGGYRFTTTDYIDGVHSYHYQDPNSLPGGANGLAAKMSYNGAPVSNQQLSHMERGDPKHNDGYFIFAAGLTYTFTNNHKAKFHGKQHLLRKT